MSNYFEVDHYVVEHDITSQVVVVTRRGGQLMGVWQLRDGILEEVAHREGLPEGLMDEIEERWG